jgi:hypothetical protein
VCSTGEETSYEERGGRVYRAIRGGRQLILSLALAAVVPAEGGVGVSGGRGAGGSLREVSKERREEGGGVTHPGVGERKLGAGRVLRDEGHLRGRGGVGGRRRRSGELEGLLREGRGVHVLVEWRLLCVGVGVVVLLSLSLVLGWGVVNLLRSLLLLVREECRGVEGIALLRVGGDMRGGGRGSDRRGAVHRWSVGLRGGVRRALCGMRSLPGLPLLLSIATATPSLLLLSLLPLPLLLLLVVRELRHLILARLRGEEGEEREG